MLFQTIQLDPAGPLFFGFPEYLTGLALVVIVWTTSDVRYRVRIRLAPMRFSRVAFSAISIIGLATLLTDLWRASSWPIIRANVWTPETWQATLALGMLLVFLAWVWFAYLRTPVFNQYTMNAYYDVIYRAIVRGDDRELRILADEISPSLSTLVTFAAKYRNNSGVGNEGVEKISPKRIVVVANYILQLLADRRFCKATASVAPQVALIAFKKLREIQVPRSFLREFSKNFIWASLTDENSFIFHEATTYDPTLLSNQKPVVEALFGDARVVAATEGLLELDLRFQWKMTSRQLSAYLDALRLTVEDLVREQTDESTRLLNEIFEIMKNVLQGVVFSRKNDVAAVSEDDSEKFQIAADFFSHVIKLLDKSNWALPTCWRKSKEFHNLSIFDHLADCFFELVFMSTSFRKTGFTAWHIQHNTLWDILFGRMEHGSWVAKLLRFKVRRAIYDEVVSIARFPNYKNTAILGYCLFVVGISARNESLWKDQYPLAKAVLSWVKPNFYELYKKRPVLRELILPSELSFDESTKRIVRVFSSIGIDENAFAEFEVD